MAEPETWGTAKATSRDWACARRGAQPLWRPLHLLPWPEGAHSLLHDPGRHLLKGSHGRGLGDREGRSHLERRDTVASRVPGEGSLSERNTKRRGAAPSDSGHTRRWQCHPQERSP